METSINPQMGVKIQNEHLMRNITALLSLLFLLHNIVYANSKNAKVSDITVEVYTTSADKSKLFEASTTPFLETTSADADASVVLNPAVKYQQMDGFGAAITGSTCYNLLKMSKNDRAKILTEIFDHKIGMGHSYVRISLGCSDFSLDEYTYCDTPGIENFEIHKLDKRDLFPILKEILAINPMLKIMASPWTPPRWMKVNNLKDLQQYNSWTSGQLNPKYYDDYATYFVKYIQEMEAEGFPIESITIQNEPLNRGNSASLFMTWQEQRDFIKTALGPQFRKNGIKTKILVYDHNYNYDAEKAECWDQIDYPLHILQDKEAAQYVHGSAWHAYGGSVHELDQIVATQPEKGIFFTEISIGDWGYTFPGDLMWCMKEVGLGTINRNGKAVIVWNLMLDDKNGPDRPGGCNTCYGAIRIDSKNYSYETLERLSHYYVISHLSKVVMPGAFRIKVLNTNATINCSAFANPDGSLALVALNDGNETTSVSFSCNGTFFEQKIHAKSIVSFRWKDADSH